MVKQTKTFKKGNVTKKALSAILAASMVMTSSSFVMAAPVEVEDVAVEAAAVEDSIEVAEENTGVVEKTFTIVKEKEISFSEAEANDAKNVVDEFKKGKVFLKINTGDPAAYPMEQYMQGVAQGYYIITISDQTGKTIELLSDGSNMPTKAGNYKVIVKGTDNLVGTIVTTGEAEGTFTIEHNKSDVNKPALELKNTLSTNSVSYTGQALEPEVVIKDKQFPANELVKGTDYDIVRYGNNTNAATSNADKAPYVEVLFKGAYKERGTEKYTFNIDAVDLKNAKVTVVNDKTVYNGEEQKPELKVEYTPAGTATPIVIPETDYVISVTSPSGETTKNAKTYKLEIAGLNNCEGTKDNIYYTISPKAFNKENISVTTFDVPFKGNGEYEADVVVKAADKTLLKDTDYKILYADHGVYSETKPIVNNPGAEIGIKIIPNSTNYTSKDGILASFKVVDLEESLSNYIIKNKPDFTGATGYTGTDSKFTYDRDGVVPNQVKINHVTYFANGNDPKADDGYSMPTENARFDVKFPAAKDCKDLGTYEIKLVGKGQWEGKEATIPYKVVAKNLGDYAGVSRINLSTESIRLYKTNNKDITFDIPDGVLKDGDYALVEGVDYTVSIKKDAAGNYYVVVEYKGNYEGKSTSSAITEVEKTALTLNSNAIKAEVKGTYVYNGTPHRPDIKNIVLTEEGQTDPLRPGIDYVIDETYGIKGYDKNIEVGQASVKLKAIGGAYAKDSTRIVYFDITADDTVKENYVLDTSKLKAVYETGDTTNNPKNDITVKTKSGAILKVDDDYTVKYLRDGKRVSDEVATRTAGTTTMEITVKATKTVFTTSFRVATSLDKVATIPTKLDDQKFTGSAISPEIKLVEKNTEIKLVEEKDYKVSYANNINHGTAYVTIEGIGDYYGTYTATFKIAGQAEQSIEVLAAQARDIQSRTMNSKATVVKFEAGKAPKTAVTYTSSDEDVVKVDETGKITYTGLGEATITIKAAETAEYKAAEATMTVKVGLTKPSFTPFSKNNAFTLTSSTVKGAEKFEVQYATKKDFSNKKSVKFTATSGKVRQVKVSAGDKKTYYVRVRAISGTETSAWSAIKTVATK